ncbi:MAG TPA: hypothetical protein VFI53_00045 [Myxococcaceae bacterium]|nr:hypothetical protein [Myxococcaceae bacterium]
MRRAALFLALAAAGCAGAPPAIGEPGAELPDPKAEAQYQAALRKVTQHREVYSGIDTQLFTAATYQSADFREARVRRQAAFQTWPEPKLDDAILRERADAAQVHEVVFGVSVVDRRFDDFDSKSSIWRLSLSTDQGEVTPVAIRRVGRANQDLRAYYPYLGDFWTMYTARFPISVGGRPLVGPDTKALIFRMSSTLGQVEMAFPVTPPPAIVPPPQATSPAIPPSAPGPTPTR